MDESKKNDGILLTEGANLVLPNIKPIRLGEYGKELQKLWSEFEKIRKNGIYVADANLVQPTFSPSFLLHGLAGRHARVGKEFVFTPPDPLTVKRITKIGVISSDVELEGDLPRSYSEEETFGTADFFNADKPLSSIQEFLSYLRRRIGIGNEYVTSLDETPNSATLMFAFNSTHPELAPLMQHSMRDNQPKDELWANGFGNYINFPMQGSGLHTAVPIGLPANFLEYIVVNENSSHWQGNRLNQLRDAAVCDSHTIPLVSATTGTVIQIK